MAQSACNLISRFVIRPWLIPIYIYQIDIFGSWLAIHAQHATGRTSHVSHRSFHIDYYYGIWTDGFIYLQSTTLRWLTSSVTPSSKWVTWVRRQERLVIDDVSPNLKFTLATITNHASYSWLIAVSSSLNPRLLMMSFSSLLANSSLTSTNR